MTRIKSGTPAEFTTRSKVCIITNSWKSLNKHVGAVQDRGMLLLFHPSSREIHRYVKDELSKFPEIYDEEVYSFIGENLGIIAEPSIRHYRTALKIKEVQPTRWKTALIESFGLTEQQMCVLRLRQDRSISHNQCAAMFAKELNLSKRTYWRVKSDLEIRGISLGNPEEKPEVAD